MAFPASTSHFTRCFLSSLPSNKKRRKKVKNLSMLQFSFLWPYTKRNPSAFKKLTVTVERIACFQMPLLFKLK